MASATIPAITSWQAILWPQVEARAHALQRRIYRAEQRGKRRKVKSLQRLLLRSRSAKLLAVRRVTQDNQGKKTAGIDGVTVVEPEDRCLMAQELNLDKPAQPLRRVWIPKPGTAEQRPLGIFVLGSRAFRKGRTSRGVFLLSVVVCLVGAIGGAVAAYYLGMWPGGCG
jgi:RNA-directed DNA polymerase